MATTGAMTATSMAVVVRAASKAVPKAAPMEALRAGRAVGVALADLGLAAVDRAVAVEAVLKVAPTAKSRVGSVGVAVARAVSTAARLAALTEVSMAERRGARVRAAVAWAVEEMAEQKAVWWVAPMEALRVAEEVGVAMAAAGRVAVERAVVLKAVLKVAPTAESRVG